MSLINKMLQDLESRKNPRAEAANKKSVFEDLKPVRASGSRASSRRLPAVVLVIVLIGAGAYGWMQWGDRLFPRETVAAGPQPVVTRTMPPKPAPVPAPAPQVTAAPAPTPVANTGPAQPIVSAQNKVNVTPAGNAPAPAMKVAEPLKAPTRTEVAPAVPEKASAPAAKSDATADAGYWIVSRGDTLYSISNKTSVDLRDLSKWNHLESRRVIYPGQRLRLTPPAAGETRSVVKFPVEKIGQGPKPDKITVAAVEKPRLKDAGLKSLPATPSSDANSTDTGVMGKKVKPLSSDEQAESEYRQAVNLLQKGRAGDAEKHLKSALQVSAEHAKARELLAGLQLQSGHWREAEQTLEQGLAKVPAYYPFAQLLARTYVDHGSDQKALAVLEGSRQAGAGSAEFMALLAALYQRTGNHPEAIKAYTEAIKLDPREGRPWLGMGISLEATQDWNAAGAAYQRAIESGALDDNLLRYARQRLTAMKK